MLEAVDGNPDATIPLEGSGGGIFVVQSVRKEGRKLYRKGKERPQTKTCSPGNKYSAGIFHHSSNHKGIFYELYIRNLNC